MMASNMYLRHLSSHEEKRVLQTPGMLVLLLFLMFPCPVQSEFPFELTYTSGPVGDTELGLVSDICANEFDLTCSIFVGGTGIAWSPDGNWIAFAARDQGHFDIFIMEVESGTRWNLTNSPETLDMDPSWSPDGRQIAFSSDRDGRKDKSTLDIFVMETDGRGVTNLTNSRNWSEKYPAWSPEGSLIAFDSDSTGYRDICVMDVESLSTVNLTDGAEGNHTDPTWSPDGTQIAFCSSRNRQAHIVRMNADGTDWVDLTPDTKSNYAPSWSPDGSLIAFVSLQDGSSIYVMDPDGGRPVNVSNDGPGGWYPVWRPISRSTAVARVPWSHIKIRYSGR